MYYDEASASDVKASDTTNASNQLTIALSAGGAILVVVD